MLEVVKYKNHLGEVISFGENGIFVNYNDLHDYEWDAISNNNKISGFSKGIVERTIPIVIACLTEEEGIETRNKLHEICEKDVLAMQYGRLIIGDFYLKCFVKASKKSEYLVTKKYMQVELIVTTDKASWIAESTTMFRKITEQKEGNKSLDYPFDYPFDYASELNSKPLMNHNFTDSEFRMIIYGGCKNPSINIGGHIYQVNAELSDSEYLTIDSIAKTVVLTKYNGEQVNKFNARNRESYVFEKIPPGEHVVVWEGDFGFDITLLEERSEPKWI
jgi:hypothetical protein